MLMIKQGFGWRGWFAVVASLCFAMPAAAHLMPAQQGTLNMVGDGVFVAVALPVSAIPAADSNGDGRSSSAELAANSATIRNYIQRNFQLFDTQGDKVELGRVDYYDLQAEPDERNGDAHTNQSTSTPDAGSTHVLLLMKASFRSAPQNLHLRTSLFGRSEAESQLTMKAIREGANEIAVLRPWRQEHQFFRSPGYVALDYVGIGISHILLGPDHLVFLLTILIAVSGWRYWLAVLTAFTLAHSISMAAALMGWVTLSAQIVEPLIAASILLMAALNLWRKHQSVLTRVLIVFACGLLHGLGFASAIADIGLHAKHQFVSLLGFNLGVEIGQVIFVGVAMGLAFGLRWITGPAAQEGSTRDPLRILPTLGSAIALGLSSMWLVQRVSL